jgi:hypothetical protein
MRQQGSEQLIRLRTVVGAGGFEQGNGFGDGAALGRATRANHGIKQCISHIGCDQITSNPRPSGKR